MVTSDTTPCVQCGETVSKSDWHPAATETTPAGDLRVHAFCAERCREQWLADTAGADVHSAASD